LDTQGQLELVYRQPIKKEELVPGLQEAFLQLPEEGLLCMRMEGEVEQEEELHVMPVNVLLEAAVEGQGTLREVMQIIQLVQVDVILVQALLDM
jgi:hypothetical protein